jgi:IclR family transcriptional regulator, pca regulon regulatory protein
MSSVPESSVPDGFAETDKEFVTAIARAMTVLEAFDETNPEMNLSELSTLTGITPATARRCLYTLGVLGYVRQSGRKFRLGPRVQTLANGYSTANRIEELVGREVQLLVETFGDPSSVAILDGLQVSYIATIARPSSVRPSARVGTRYPAHATSLGKVLLAYADRETRLAYLSRGQLEAPTDRTVSNPDTLALELDKTVAQGFAIAVDELEYGVASIAVPIFDKRGNVIAAINSSGYSGRHSAANLIENRLAILRDCARTISTRLVNEYFQLA